MSAPANHGPSGPAPGTRLESWKEVAVYLKREISTVQRWERLEHLPIHRHVHGKGGSIYAFTGEIDEWRRQRTTGGAIDQGNAAAASASGGEAPAPASRDGHAEPGTVGDMPAGRAPSSAPDVEPLPAAMPPLRRRWLARMVVGAVLAAVVVGTGLWWRATRPGSAADGQVRSLAVLPLRDLSHEPREDYFADGMTEAIIARLAGTTSLKVTSRTSAMQFKRTDRPLPDIANALQVDALIDGSVTRVGDRVRIIATLVDGRTDSHLWSGEFERPIENVLALQGEIADAIAKAVRATVQASGRSGAVAREVSSESYQHYLKGRYLLNENTRTSLQQAVREFDAALVADPSFAPAHAGLASAHEDLSNTIIGAPVGAGWNERSIAAAERALELDPDLAEAHSALARGLMGQFKWPEAEAAFRRALALNPSDARTHLWLGEWLAAMGRADEAVASARQALALDPLAIRTMAASAFVLGSAGRHDEAIQQLRTAVAVRPDYFQAAFFLGNSLEATGQAREALVQLERAAALSHRSPDVLVRLAQVHARAGRRAEAARLANEVLERQEQEWVPPSTIAGAYLALGRHDEALTWLERAVDERTRGTHLLTVSAVFADLRGTPRFDALLRRVTAGSRLSLQHFSRPGTHAAPLSLSASSTLAAAYRHGP